MNAHGLMNAIIDSDIFSNYVYEVHNFNPKFD